MISNRRRSFVLAAAMLPGAAVAMQFRWSAAQQATPPGGLATPCAATPPSAGGPVLVGGHYQLPDDPQATVVYLTFGNPTLPPEYQYGYDVTIDASGHAVVTISPVGSRAASSGGTPTTEQTEELGEDGLQGLLDELCDLGFFALPPVDPDKLLIGGEVDEIDVSLADGTWPVNAWSLETTDQRARFADAHEAILRAVGIEEPPDLGH